MADAPFKRGDVVLCSANSDLEEPGRWRGLAIVHSYNTTYKDMEVGLVWIVASRDYFFNHIEGCDAYVPAEWLTKVGGVEHG